MCKYNRKFDNEDDNDENLRKQELSEVEVEKIRELLCKGCKDREIRDIINENRSVGVTRSQIRW